MTEYIRCREFDSPYCKGCNLKNLETMLRNGKFDCIMNENRCIDTDADVAPVVYGRWAHLGGDEWCCTVCGFVITTEGSWDKPTKKYCEDCGAKMDECNEPEN